MRTLVVVRHAKAEQDHPGGDYARELAPRGVLDATELGRWLAGQGLSPDLVIASPAARTRQTAAHVLEGAGCPDVQTWTGRGLYDGGPAAVLGAVHEAPDEASIVWVVGHQPIMGIVAAGLADPETSEPGAVAAIEQGFSTATAAVVEVDGPWEELRARGGRLTLVHTARG